MSRLAHWCFRHRFTVLASWVVLLGSLGVLSSSIGSAYSNAFSLPGTQSTRATDLLASQFRGQSGDVDSIVLHASTGTVTTPAIQAQVRSVLAQVARVPEVGAVLSPFTPQGASQVGGDRTVAYASVTFTGQAQNVDKADIRRVMAIGSQLRSPNLQVEFGGAAISGLNAPKTSSSELIGFAAAAVVLVLAFGSLLAMVIPLIAAILALGCALFTIELVSHVIGVAAIGPEIAALVGIGVSIDYALFIVTRHRNGLRAGLSPQDAAVTALNTSGRAIMFAGATVMVAMLGLLILGISFLSGIGIAAAVMIAFAVAVATTLLPALFGLFGMRLLSRRQRAALRREGPADVNASGPWARWAGYVQRRPTVLAIAAAAVMVTLVIPVFSLRLGSSDAGNDPASTTTRQAYDLLARGFGPGYNGPLELVAQVPDTAAGSDLAALGRALNGQPGVASVRVSPALPGATVRVIRITPTTSPESTQTSTLIDTLRNTVIPRYEHDGLTVYVGGETAIYKDFATVIGGKIPLFIAIIVVLGCLLLMLAFRSIIIPLTAAVMNLLSAGAAFGIVVAVFQWGWGSNALGAGSAGPVESFLPAMMLAVLFGLSMDYEVFLVSRINEEWMMTSDNPLAVRLGQAATGRVITAASTIMICVFVAFVFGGERIIAEFGVGLAAAILLDALVVRTILVPAVMQLFGRANWYLPKSMDRILPHLSVEAPDASPAVGQPDPQPADRH